MNFGGLDKVSRAAINWAYGDISPKKITLLRHMARNGAGVSEMAAAIEWPKTESALRGRLKKLNITPGPAKTYEVSGDANTNFGQNPLAGHGHGPSSNTTRIKPKKAEGVGAS